MKRRTCGLVRSGLLAILLSVGGLSELRMEGAEEAGGESVTNEAPGEVKPDPLAAWFEAQSRDRQLLQQAIDDLRRQLDSSSKQILDQTSKDAQTLSREVQASLSSRLDLIERTLAQSQQRELDALRSANRTFLTVAGVFAGLGVLGILIAALILARSINHFSEVALSLPAAARPLAASSEHPALGPGDAEGAAQLELANSRLSQALERLQQRVAQMESWGESPLPGPGPGGANGEAETPMVQGGSPLKQIASALGAAGSSPPNARGPRTEASMLLGKGQALLNLGQAEQALGCFDQALELEPRNAEALVKRGMAMERLQRMDQAIESYDRAIAVDDSFTLAYLYKGAVCNKLQRFQEALDCYERALRSEQTTVTT